MDPTVPTASNTVPTVTTQATLSNEIVVLEQKLHAVQLPPDLLEKSLAMTHRLSRMVSLGNYSSEYEAIARYIDWVVNLPWAKKSDDTLDLKNAKAMLDKNHYGLAQTKDRILEYLAVLALRAKDTTNDESAVSRAPILCLVGLVGTGKTTLAISIAEAMGRKFERIPFGGMGDSLTLRGQARAFPDAEPGAVMKALRRAGTKNPVILLDEIDRVSEAARADIMGVLVELLDPQQNARFTDHFLDHPFDLSEVLFVATSNNTTNISTAVMDRLEPIQMPSYSDTEKIAIAKTYVFPKAIKFAGIKEGQLTIADDVWAQIVRPLGFDSGIRTLERTVQGVCRKVARKIIEGQGTTFTITVANVKEFLPVW